MESKVGSTVRARASIRSTQYEHKLINGLQLYDFRHRHDAQSMTSKIGLTGMKPA